MRPLLHKIGDAQRNEARVGPTERGMRGGAYDSSVGIVGASSWFRYDPTDEFVFGPGITGFRIASSAAVPEPSTYAMAAMGLLGLFGFGYARTRRHA